MIFLRPKQSQHPNRPTQFRSGYFWFPSIPLKRYQLSTNITGEHPLCLFIFTHSGEELEIHSGHTPLGSLYWLRTKITNIGDIGYPPTYMGDLLSSQYQSLFSGFTRQIGDNKVMCDVINNNSNIETKYSESIKKRISWVHYTFSLCLHNVINISKYKAGAYWCWCLDELQIEFSATWPDKVVRDKTVSLDQRKHITYGHINCPGWPFLESELVKHMNNKHINEQEPLLEGLCAITQINAHWHFMKAQPDRVIFHNNNKSPAGVGWKGKRNSA